MEEQPPAQPDSTPLMPPPAADVSAPARPAARSRGGCATRLLSALLVIVITTFLALAAVAIGLVYLGFTPTTPLEFDQARVQLATLQSQNSALQTQVAAHDQRGEADHETLGELKREFEGLANLRSQLSQERESSAIQSATLIADVRASRDSVAVFATAEAGRAALLSELDRRSARVERFLQRLGDIANDTALDLGSATPAAPISSPTLASTATAASLASPTLPASATPAADITATRTPEPTPAATRPPNSTPRSASPTPTAGR